MADGPGRTGRAVGFGVVAVGLVLGLTGCTVHDETLVSSNGRADFVKECGPTAATITATNTGPATRDLSITTGGVLRAARAAVPTGGRLSWTGPVDVTQAQVGFDVSGGGGPDELIVANLPPCR